MDVSTEEAKRKAKCPKEKRKSIIRTLVLTENTHSFVVHKDRAKSIGLKISEDNKGLLVLNVMREWEALYPQTYGDEILREILGRKK